MSVQTRSGGAGGAAKVQPAASEEHPSWVTLDPTLYRLNLVASEVCHPLSEGAVGKQPYAGHKVSVKVRKASHRVSCSVLGGEGKSPIFVI